MFDVEGECDQVPPDPADPLSGLGGDDLTGPPTSAAELARAAAGCDLAYLIEQFDPDSAEDGDVVEALAAVERLASWTYRTSARLAARLSERRSMNPTWSRPGGLPTEPCVAGDEIAMRLGWSRRAGQRLVRDGRALDGHLTWTGDAVADGRLDRAKARVLIERLETVGLPVALEVQERVLPGAPGRTPQQLRRDVERALLAVDPVDAAHRRVRAREGRRVERCRTLPDGMAGLWAVLSAEDAVRIDATLDVAARSARAAGDPRTLDQLRADGLTDLVLGGEVRSEAAGGPRRVRPPAQIRVTVPLSTLMGLDEHPADLAGYGPLSAVQARALARDGTWRRLVTDPLSGAVLDVGRTRYRPPAELAEHVRARDRYCFRPGCSADAETCDLDHTDEFHQPDGAGGRTAEDNLGPGCRRDHRLKTDGGHRLSQPSPGEYVWTTPTGHRYRVTPGADGPAEHLGHLDRSPPDRAAESAAPPGSGHEVGDGGTGGRRDGDGKTGPDRPPF